MASGWLKKHVPADRRGASHWHSLSLDMEVTLRESSAQLCETTHESDRRDAHGELQGSKESLKSNITFRISKAEGAWIEK